MARLIKLVVVLAVLGLVALAGYSYGVDMTPPSVETTVPVMLNEG